MKKSANLKKRLEELRDEPEATVEVVLQLDAALYRTLKKLAAQERLSLEAYIARSTQYQHRNGCRRRSRGGRDRDSCLNP